MTRDTVTMISQTISTVTRVKDHEEKELRHEHGKEYVTVRHNRHEHVRHGHVGHGRVAHRREDHGLDRYRCDRHELIDMDIAFIEAAIFF
jgi:hypothetical protein